MRPGSWKRARSSTKSSTSGDPDSWWAFPFPPPLPRPLTGDGNSLCSTQQVNAAAEGDEGDVARQGWHKPVSVRVGREQYARSRALRIQSLETLRTAPQPVACAFSSLPHAALAGCRHAPVRLSPGPPGLAIDAQGVLKAPASLVKAVNDVIPLKPSPLSLTFCSLRSSR